MEYSQRHENEAIVYYIIQELHDRLFIRNEYYYIFGSETASDIRKRSSYISYCFIFIEKLLIKNIDNFLESIEYLKKMKEQLSGVIIPFIDEDPNTLNMIMIDCIDEFLALFDDCMADIIIQ